MTLRIGQGYDAHRLLSKEEFAHVYPGRAGASLVLGGVSIPHDKILAGHSDADVLVHAIIDSLLGALALGDIGKHFPDSSKDYEAISSIELLKRVSVLIADAGYKVVNIDSTIIAQKPKLAPYILQMRENISKALGVAAGQVSVKATTTEGMGFEGTEEGISAAAVALLSQ